ncbi:MAG: RING finger protein [Chloroflexota bacterium]
MAVRTYVVDKDSPFLGEACALCKQPFAPGDEVAICPEDATRHHSLCWRANGNKCTAYGCTGSGILLPATRGGRRAASGRPTSSGRTRVVEGVRSKVKVSPATGVHIAQTCLLLAIAIAIILIAVGCFGLWAIADFIMNEILGWRYRAPQDGAAILDFGYWLLALRFWL